MLGLAPCIQVAAAASSLALSKAGEVYQWGGSARLLGAANRSGSAAVARDSTPAVKKAPHEWLVGVEIVQVACGIENAAAVTSDSKLVMWGGKRNMPPSMLQQAKALAINSSDKAVSRGLSDAAGAAATDGGQLMQTKGDESSVAAIKADDTAAQGAVAAIQVAHAITVTLTVSSNGHVAVTCSYPRQIWQPHSACPAEGQHTATGQALKVVTAGLMPDLADDHLAEPSPVDAATDSHSADDSTFDPDREPIKGLCCGEAHHVVLCQPSQYTPAIGMWTRSS